MSRPRAFDAAKDGHASGTAAFSKFVRIIELIAEHDRPLSLTELSKLSGFPRPTVHRTVAGLIAERFLYENQDTRALELGPRLIQLASKGLNQSWLRRAASDELLRLRDRTGETVHLAVPSQHAMVYIDKLESPNAVSMRSAIGSSVPMQCSSVGKAYLAKLDSVTRTRLIGEFDFSPVRLPKAAKSAEDFLIQLQEVEKQGWALDDEEFEEGIQCFGVAIIGPLGQPVAAINITTLAFRRPKDYITAFVQPLMEAGAAISARLGNAEIRSGS